MSLLERVEAAKQGKAVPAPDEAPSRAVVPTTPASAEPVEASQSAMRVSAREDNFRRIRTQVELTVANALSSRIDLTNPEAMRQRLAADIDELVADFIYDNELSLTRDERQGEGQSEELHGGFS